MGVSIPLIIAAGVSAYSAISAGNAQAAQQKRLGQAAQTNATIDAQNATAAKNVAAANEGAQLRKNEVALGQQRGALLQSGTGSDAAASVVGQSAQNLEMDALNIRYGGTQQSAAFTNKGLLDTQAAANYDANAGDAKSAGYVGAAASLIGGGAKAYGAANAKPTTVTNNYYGA